MVDETRLYKAIGERIKQLRMSQSGGAVTQADLARLVGLERTSITNIEKGNQKVSLLALYRICEALKVSLADALPNPADIQSEKVATADFDFADTRVEATPLVKQALMAVLNRSS